MLRDNSFETSLFKSSVLSSTTQLIYKQVCFSLGTALGHCTCWRRRV